MDRYFAPYSYANPYLSYPTNRDYLNFYNPPLYPYEAGYLNQLRNANSLAYGYSKSYPRPAQYPYYSYYQPNLYKPARNYSPPILADNNRYALKAENRKQPKVTRPKQAQPKENKLELELAELKLNENKNGNATSRTNQGYKNEDFERNKAALEDFIAKSENNLIETDFFINQNLLNTNSSYTPNNEPNTQIDQQNQNISNNDYIDDNNQNTNNAFLNDLENNPQFYVNKQGRLTQMNIANPLRSNNQIHDYLYSLSKQDDNAGYVEKYKDTQRRRKTRQPRPAESLKEFKRFKENAGFGFDFLDPNRSNETNQQKIEKVNKRSEYAKYVKDRNLSIANKKNVYNPELVNSISLPDILPNRYPEALRLNNIGPSRFSN